MALDYEEHFIRDPHICAGETVIKGTRVPLRTVLCTLAEGASIQEIVQDFPTLTEADVQAAIAFAGAVAAEAVLKSDRRHKRSGV